MMGLRTSVLRLGQTIGPFAFTFTAENAFEKPLTGYRWLLFGVGSFVAVAGLVLYIVVRDPE
jgi:hypothetical protein